METKANYALIGAFVLSAFIAAIAFVAWVSNSQFDQQFEQYEVIFTGAVRGLTQGGEVRYNGLRVGEVTRLSLDPENSNSVVAFIEVDANTPVHTNSYAQLEPQGLTGLSYIQIFSGGDEFPLLKDLGRGPYQIPGELSAIDGIIDGGVTVVKEAERALISANNVLDEKAIADFQGILANVNSITSKLNEAEIDPEGIQGLIDQFTQTAKDVSAASARVTAVAAKVEGVLDEDLDPVLADVRSALSGVDAAVANYDALAVEGKELVVDARDAINRLSNSGLTDLEETTDSLRLLVGSLNRIASQLERAPLQFIVGDAREVVEIPQ